MHGPYRIAIADKNASDVAFLVECLTHAGHNIVLKAQSREELARTVSAASPDILIVDIALAVPEEVEGTFDIPGHDETPVIVTSGADIESTINRLDRCRVFAHLSKPIREEELKVAIEIVRQRFHELKHVQDEASSARQALEDRKIIERAKGILMRERAVDEPTAFRFLQDLARQHRQKLIDVANSIVLADKALKPNIPLIIAIIMPFHDFLKSLISV
jgi:AmiR/NasT family two-component response regulator